MTQQTDVTAQADVPDDIAWSSPAATVLGAFTDAVRYFPDREAVVYGAYRVTYRQLEALVRDCAAQMQARGVHKGSRVVFVSTTGPAVLIVFLACARLGAIFAGVGTRTSQAELEHIVDDLGPTLMFTVASVGDRDHAAEMEGIAESRRLEWVDVGTTRDGALPSGFEQFLADGGALEQVRTPELSPDDAAVIIYTSGTTGPPKGAVLSNRALTVAARAKLDDYPLVRPRMLSFAPIDHLGFISVETMHGLMCAATLVQLDRFEPETVVRTFVEERITCSGLLPIMVHRILEKVPAGLPGGWKLDLLWWGGGLDVESIRGLQPLAKHLAVSYGMTEAAGGLTLSPPGCPPERLASTAGVPHTHVDLKLRGGGDGTPDEPLEILFRGPNLMTGYWNKPEQTVEAFEDGYFKTGDLGYLRDGELYIAGRQKELIRTGGYNVWPTEVENSLLTHPGVAMVSVIGVPDPEYGEQVVAVWSPAEGSIVSDDELRDHVRSTLARYKVPRRLIRVDTLPLLRNGKVNRLGVAAIVRERSATSDGGGGAREDRLR